LLLLLTLVGVVGLGVVFQAMAGANSARGDNPVSAFRAVVNCLTPDSPTSGVNLVTDPFLATAAGDATIDARLELPSTCVALIAFVTNGARRLVRHHGGGLGVGKPGEDGGWYIRPPLGCG
jgi:hypothetical protein